MKVCVIGLGYIGLPTALHIASNNISVIGYDIDKERINRIANLDPIIQEPNIKNILYKVITNKLFTVSHTLSPSDFYIIAVPTPCTKEKKADLTAVWHAIDTLSQILTQGNTIILESTVPIGTTQKIAQLLQERTGLTAGIDFFLAHCPERVLPGNIMKELRENARIIGGINQQSVNLVKKLYSSFVTGPLYLTNATTAEMIKLIENSARDVAIAFAHEIATIAEKFNLNPYEIIELANKHPRVNILQPTCGVGGHCIPIDPWFLIESFPQNTTLLQAARAINEATPQRIIHKINHTIATWKQKKQHDPRLLILGLTYKPNVDDIRESPALYIAQTFAKKYTHIAICEPYLSQESVHNLLNVSSTDISNGLSKSDIIICLVKHDQFNSLTIQDISDKVILDFCGLLYLPHQKDTSNEYYFWPAQEIKFQEQV